MRMLAALVIGDDRVSSGVDQKLDPAVRVSRAGHPLSGRFIANANRSQ
ncbi:hypothetical protein [Aerolutibacter ruishenii]|uniref:Uncharacterized protein n=1 Tax=Aerolutibacter ruishenii TaxID=686800 RepID=A0A562LGT1_9GAMM|nr:hypothetical protein [Lysobacter ruishenii]TWI06838.1 hypothetical protein IP93_02830 [Lysobacter ruishenii]